MPHPSHLHSTMHNIGMCSCCAISSLFGMSKAASLSNWDCIVPQTSLVSRPTRHAVPTALFIQSVTPNSHPFHAMIISNVQQSSTYFPANTMRGLHTVCHRVRQLHDMWDIMCACEINSSHSNVMERMCVAMVITTTHGHSCYCAGM